MDQEQAVVQQDDGSETPAAAPKSTVITVGGKEIDYSKGLPLKFGQWKKLRKQFDVDLFRLKGENVDVTHISAIALVVLNRVDTEITEDDLDELDAQVVMDVATAAMSRGDVNPPT